MSHNPHGRITTVTVLFIGLTVCAVLFCGDLVMGLLAEEIMVCKAIGGRQVTSEVGHEFFFQVALFHAAVLYVGLLLYALMRWLGGHHISHVILAWTLVLALPGIPLAVMSVQYAVHLPHDDWHYDACMTQNTRPLHPPQL